MKQSMAAILPLRLDSSGWTEKSGGLIDGAVCVPETRGAAHNQFGRLRLRADVLVRQPKTSRSDNAQSADSSPLASIKPEVTAERGEALRFLGVDPPSVAFLHIVSSRRQNDTLTLQVDKCVLTTLAEISTRSAGSLPGTRFYLHLLRLAEETLNLLHDLWLQF